MNKTKEFLYLFVKYTISYLTNVKFFFQERVIPHFKETYHVLTLKQKLIILSVFSLLILTLGIDFESNVITSVNNKTELQIKQRTEGLYEAGVFLVKKYEGLYLMPYVCPAGIPTIGWGHTFEYYEKNGKILLTKKGKEELAKYRNGISFTEAQEIFRNEYLKNLENTSKKIGNVKERNHLLALTSVAYNAGEYGMYGKGTAPGKSYSKGESEATVADKIKNRFRKNTSFVTGIKKRRKEESKLFSSEYDDILKMSENWKKEVQSEILTVLPKYGLSKENKNRQNEKPLQRRAKCEMDENTINYYLSN